MHYEIALAQEGSMMKLVQKGRLRHLLVYLRHYNVLGSIHTCNSLGVDYCMDFSVQAIMTNGTQPIIKLFNPGKI